MNDTFEVTLTENAVFKPHCTGGGSGIVRGGPGDISTITDLRAPFYASTSPQIFAIASATIISYFLVILIFITPRTFFVGGPGGGAGFLTRRGLGGNYATIGVGRRPMLQKIAAVMVALAMTIATADTFNVAKKQYEAGFMDSEAMVRQVVGLLEIRIVQVVSDTFVWLAQVQTLIRLFPRHKEKVTIKWLGFGLISLDVVFSSVNHFVFYGHNPRPVARTRDAVPALSYLFELAIGFIYASCIIYYAISKYRFAFYHAKMRNICLVALLSLTSVLIPVVFFIIDVSSAGIATWGFYIEWVGAAAASVVVWEWVERIEALERDEKKDGILGREIYDGDEMLDSTFANGVDWPGRRPRHGGAGHRGGQTTRSEKLWDIHGRPLRSRVPFLNKRRNVPLGSAANARGNQPTAPVRRPNDSNNGPPSLAPTPVSRTDNTSAASTIYAIRYHDAKSTSPPVPISSDPPPVVSKDQASESTTEPNGIEIEKADASTLPHAVVGPHIQYSQSTRPIWMKVSNPFKRKRASPPAEVAGAQMLEENTQGRSQTRSSPSEKWNIKSRVDTFRTARRENARSGRQTGDHANSLRVTVIPAQDRGNRSWSPEDLATTTEVSNRRRDGSDKKPWQMFTKASTSNQNMDVTVVPAPVRGERTWSPDDLLSPQAQQSGPAREHSLAQVQVINSSPAGASQNQDAGLAEPLEPAVSSEDTAQAVRHSEERRSTCGFCSRRRASLGLGRMPCWR